MRKAAIMWLAGAVLAMLSPLLAATPAAAQPYPNRAVRIVVPFPPGGPTDITARLYAERLTQRLGQPFIVENRPGAGGVVAMNAVLASPADGHTLAFGTPSSQVLPDLTFHPRPYDSLRDFVAVSLLAEVPIVLVVAPATGFRTPQDLIAAARAAPGTLNYGSDGIASSTHVGAEMFSLAAGIRTTHVPFRGSAAVMQSLVRGDIQYSFSGVQAPLPLHREGQVRIIGIAGPARLAALPEVPTIAEAGIADFDLTTWFALFARAGTDRAIVDRLSEEIRAVASMPEVVQRIAAGGLTARASSPAELDAIWHRYMDKWSEVVRHANIRIE